MRLDWGIRGAGKLASVIHGPPSSVERPGLRGNPRRERGSRVAHAPGDGLAITRDRHQGEIDPVKMVLEVEDPGEARPREVRLVPRTVGRLGTEQELDALADRISRSTS